MRIGKAFGGTSAACLFAVACGGTISLESHPACPCAAGWSCCDGACVSGSCPADGGHAQAQDATAATGAEASASTFTLLDPMTSPTTVLGTYWYASSDRTCPYSCPPVFVANQPGTLSPGEGQQFLPIASPNGPMIDGQAWPYREFTGGGETTWGVAVGFDLQDAPGVSPVAACAARSCGGSPGYAGNGDAMATAMMTAIGPADANDVEAAAVDGGGNADQCKDGTYPFTAVLYNASAHQGLSFWARAPDTRTAPPILELLVSDKRTSPVGGVCDPCLSGGAGACNDDFGYPTLLTAQWQQYVVLFSQLAKSGWSGSRGTLDLTTIGGVSFALQTQLNGAPLSPFRIQIAYVQWVDG